MNPLCPPQHNQALPSSARNPNLAPYHSKLVSRIDLDALESLPADDAAIAAKFKMHRHWCDDDMVYSMVPILGADACTETRLLPGDIALSIEHGTVAEIAASDVRGPLNAFTTFEPFKGPNGRRRGIKEPKHINLCIGTDLIDPDMMIASKKEILAAVHKGTHFAQFDGKSWYDQFPLSESVSSRMCFKKGNKFFRQATLPAGMKTSVQVGHSGMRQLQNVPGGRTHRLAIIDNGLLVGGYDAVLHDLLQVRDRAKIANITLNEAEIIETNPESMIVQRDEFGGVWIDLETKESALTEKIVLKVKMSFENRHRWTVRGFAAHVGLLFWSVGIIDIPIGSFFALLQFISRTGQLMSELEDDPTSWDRPIRIWPTAMKDIEDWTALCIANKKKKVDERLTAADATWLVATDACRWGWGYVAVNTLTNEVRYHGERWSWHFWRHHGHKLHRSTFTEPWGVYFSCCHLITHTGQKQHIVIGTDNTVTEASVNRGYNAHSFDINHCIQELRKMYPPSLYSFECHYIPGEINKYLADPLSRHGVTSEDTGQIAQRLRRELGGATKEPVASGMTGVRADE